MTTTQLAVIPEGTYAMLKRDPRVIMESLREVVGTEDPTVRDLDRIKVPTGGSVTWAVPAPGGAVDAKEYTGVILGWKTNRVYWSKPMGEGGGGGAQPDCYSDDGSLGVGEPALAVNGSCADCALSKFGPNQGDRPQCREVRVLLVLRPDIYLPEIVIVPPSSLKPCREYFISQVAKYGYQLSGVETTFTLEKDKSANGIVYSKMAFALGGELDPAEAERMYAMAAQLKPLFNRVRVDVQDVYGPDAAPSAAAGAAGGSDDFDDEP